MPWRSAWGEQAASAMDNRLAAGGAALNAEPQIYAVNVNAVGLFRRSVSQLSLSRELAQDDGRQSDRGVPVAQAAAQRMVAQRARYERRGKVLFTGSWTQAAHARVLSVSGASKGWRANAGARMATGTKAAEGAPVNVVAPGAVDAGSRAALTRSDA